MAFTIPNDVTGGTVEQHAQASPDAVDIDILVAALNGNGVISGCAVTGNNDMAPSVASGTVHIGGTLATVSGGTVTITTAHATLPRFDLVVVDNAGTKSVTAGTAAASPVFPAIPANSVVLAAVYVAAGDTTINTADIIDKRCLLLLGAANTWTANQTISNTAPSLILTDTTASAKSLTVAVDANLAQLRESAGASGSLLVLDLANNRVGVGTEDPSYALDVLNAGPKFRIASSTSESATAATSIVGASYLQLGGREYIVNSYRLLTFGYHVPGTNTYSPAYIGYQETSEDSNTYGDLIFGTRSVTTDTEPSERLRITNTGNVGIGTTTPSASALLELSSTTGALLLPRMTTTQRDALTAVDGMMIYNSTTGAMNYRKAGAWVAI